MATLDQDEDKLKQGQSGGGGAYIGGGSGQGATTGIKSDSPSSSGNYTNLQNYLTANQGADEAMGQGAAGVANAAGQGATQSMDTMQNNANNEIGAGTVNVDPEKENQISFNPGAGFRDTISQLSMGQTDFAPQYNYSGPESVDTSYKGPNSYNEISGALDTAGKVGNAQTVADQAKTTPGVSTLLKSAYNQPGYSSGENQLDTFVTQAGQGGQNQLNKIGQDWGGITDNANKMYGGIQSQIQGGKETSKATGDTYAGEISQAKSDIAGANTAITDAKAAGQAKLAQQKKDKEAAVGSPGVMDQSVVGATPGAPKNLTWTEKQEAMNYAFGGKVPYNKYSGISNMINGRKKQ